MEDWLNAPPASQRRLPWNKGKLTGQTCIGLVND
jgi:hypothetical protein